MRRHRHDEAGRVRVDHAAAHVVQLRVQTCKQGPMLGVVLVHRYTTTYMKLMLQMILLQIAQNVPNFFVSRLGSIIFKIFSKEIYFRIMRVGVD